MPGAPLLPTTEYPDDFQLTVLGPFAAADLIDRAIFFPDRDIVIDRAWVSTGIDGTGQLRLIRGVGPVGGTGGDADENAILASGRFITGTINLEDVGDNDRAFFTIGESALGQRNNNVIKGNPYVVAGNTVYDFVMLEALGPNLPALTSSSSSSGDAATVASTTGLFIYLRWRSVLN